MTIAHCRTVAGNRRSIFAKESVENIATLYFLPDARLVSNINPCAHAAERFIALLTETSSFGMTKR